ncbi:MAG: hypothetical protein PWQ61_1593 [Betaproteobacteria bacterium]|nr:hypothetical protein [Betaproteobacteria bacterium]
MSIDDDQARTIPDELFKDDPEIIRLHQSHETAYKRLEFLKRGRDEKAAIGSKVESLIHRTRAQIQRANEALALAALDDLAAGDLEFSRALDLLDHIEELERVLRVASLATQATQNPPSARLVDSVEASVVAARSRLSSGLLEKKRAHLKDNPTAVA